MTVQVDGYPPQVAVTSPVANAMVSGVFQVSANANSSVGIDRVEFFVNDVLLSSDSSSPYAASWDTRVLPNGPATVRARAWSSGGRFADSIAPVSVYNDLVLPTVTLTAPTDGSVVSGWISLTATATDNGTLSSVQFLVDGVVVASDYAPLYEVLWNSGNVANGPHTVTARATDSQGNVATSGAAITVDNDLISPTVSITSPAAGSTVEGTISLTADAADERGVVKVEFLLDGILLSTDTSSPWAAAWNTASGSQASRTVTARAYDAAGHVTTSAGVTVTPNNDLSSPVLNISSPAVNATVSGVVQVSATATDDRGVTHVKFLVDDVVVLTQTATPYGFAWDTTTLANGSHRIGARAYDAALHVSASSRFVTVSNDSIAPSVSLLSPKEAEFVQGVLTLSANASDDVGVTRVEFLIDGAIVGSNDRSVRAELGQQRNRERLAPESPRAPGTLTRVRRLPR